MPELARIRQRLEPGLGLQIPEEAPQELRTLLLRLVRHRLLERGVQRVEQRQQHLQHLQRRRPPHPVAGQHFLRRQSGPVLAA